jgi:hypothetical protein
MANPKKASAKKRAAAEEVTEVRGELRQLAALRAKFPVLPEALAAGLLAQHDDDACRARGTTTRSADTFKGAMAWARTVGAHAADAGFSPARSRWFFDCLTNLGTLLSGKSAAANPAAGSALDDAQYAAEALIARTRRSLENAVGSHKIWTVSLAEALVPDPALDAHISVLRQLAAQITAWLKAPAATPPAAPPLAGFDVDAKTAAALVAAAKALDAAIAVRPPPAQIDRDSPAINAAEGRLYFIMRVLWDDLAEARKAGASSLQLSVTPTLLRGLNLSARKRAKSGSK